ncbi:UNVERIFIED_CONTAM: hypothetical protein PYX00_004558 [Menopon gallinae]|uniref:Lysophospholipid acyltransferase 5 n=1 Tax=Menopon gallinae TaxID=328185 RepID=A0AAW2I4W7_9NEOP
MDVNGMCVESLAQSIGSSEPALRLLLSLLMCYPLSFFHRSFLYGKNVNLQHLYFICGGVGICYFNYGFDVIHSFVSISICYLVLRILGGGTLSLAIVFIYAMGHLLYGYWYTATGDYDIKWTMPQCVLTLRLIGLAFNLSDGRKQRDKLSEQNKQVALESLPPPLAVFAHCYFPSSFLIGPQFPIKRYLDFVELKLEKKENVYELPNSIGAGSLNLCLGLIYLGVYQGGSLIVSDETMISEEYKCLPLWKQCLLLGLWARLTLYKYISCWLITEGSLTIFGITYNGVDQNGIAKWDGCSNVKISVFESATRMNHYIESFNTNTNNWVAQYIYKRLKFLNNRILSQVGVLLFLAVWHGFHSGYYATFFFEFVSILSEKQLVGMLNANGTVPELLGKPFVYPFVYVFLRLYTFETGFCGTRHVKQAGLGILKSGFNFLCKYIYIYKLYEAGRLGKRSSCRLPQSAY